MISLNSLQAVIFDMDGVLIDSEPLHERAQRIVFANNRIQVPNSVFTDFKGQTEEDVFEYVVAEFGNDQHDPVQLVRQKHEAYRSLMGDLRPIDGSVAFVQYLHEHGLRMALTTSATRRDQEYAMRALALAEHFETIVTADDVTRFKPDPEPYLATVGHLRADPGRCLVIEDSLNGIRSALDAGCLVAGISTSFSKDALATAGAHVVVASFDELRTQLEQPE